MKAEDAQILVVDDDTHIRRLVTTILKRENFAAVDEARDGLEAVEAMHDKRYDVVLLDLMMPIMSGFEVADKIAEEYAEDDKCVVVMTAAGPAGIEKLNQRNVYAILQKPFDIPELLQTVQECVRTHCDAKA